MEERHQSPSAATTRSAMQPIHFVILLCFFKPSCSFDHGTDAATRILASIMSERESFVTFVDDEERKVHQSLHEMLHNDQTRRQRHNSNSSRRESVESTRSSVSSVPLISIPTSEFCSLNMRLLERNNEVKLAMETACHAESKLNEYKKSADEAICKLKLELARHSGSGNCKQRR